MFGTKTLRRSMAVLGAAALLALPMGMATANAEPDYPPVFYQINATSFTAKIGGHVKFTAQTFSARSTVNVNVSEGGTSVGSSTTTANKKGVAKSKVTFTVVGVNSVTMSGTSDTGQDLALTADVTVTAAGGNGVVPVTNGGNNGGNTDNGSGNGSGSGDAADGSNAAGGVPFLGGGLPRTGGEIAATVLVAAVLLGAGFLLVIATRRRRSSH